MAGDEPPKSAVELAMERLRRKDADMGIEQLTLTDEQRAAIAEIRNFYEARIAEQKILHEAALRKALDPAEREALEAGARHDRERLVAERDAKIAKIRKTE
jgi:hypothetical protein